MELRKIIYRLWHKFEFEAKWSFSNIKAHRLLNFSRFLYLVAFSISFFWILGQFIVFPTDKEEIAKLDPIDFHSFSTKWTGDCNKYSDVKRYSGRLTDEEISKLKDICFVKISPSNAKFLGPALNLNDSILQKQICISGDNEYISEQEYDSNHESVWDLREFGNITNNSKCLVLYDINQDTYVPIKIHPGFEKITIVKNLAYGYRALVSVYILVFIFNTIIWMSIINFLRPLHTIWEKQ